MKPSEYSNDFHEVGCEKAVGLGSYIGFRVNNNHNLWLVFRDRRANSSQTIEVRGENLAEFAEALEFVAARLRQAVDELPEPEPTPVPGKPPVLSSQLAQPKPSRSWAPRRDRGVQGAQLWKESKL